jgi:hypothetical protein
MAKRNLRNFREVEEEYFRDNVNAIMKALGYRLTAEPLEQQ